jgi:hypothetical protein
MPIGKCAAIRPLAFKKFMIVAALRAQAREWVFRNQYSASSRSTVTFAE